MKGGKFSQHLDSLKIGDFVGFRGPKGRIAYRGNGIFEGRLDKRWPGRTERRFKRIGMIAGGVGIAPMLQVGLYLRVYSPRGFFQIINAVLEDPNDQTEITLLYSNHAEYDIICRYASVFAKDASLQG